MTNKTYTQPDALGIFAKELFGLVGETAVITFTQGKTTTIGLADLPAVAPYMNALFAKF